MDKFREASQKRREDQKKCPSLRGQLADYLTNNGMSQKDVDELMSKLYKKINEAIKLVIEDEIND